MAKTRPSGKPNVVTAVADCGRNRPRGLADGVGNQALNYLERLTLRLIRALV